MRLAIRVALALTAAHGLLLAAPSHAAAAKCDVSSGTTGNVSIEAAGSSRTFVVRAPSANDAKAPRPVVFVFHGFTMNARFMERLADFTAAWPEAIVVYPQGLPRRFPNMPVGEQPGWQISPGELEDRDLAFFDAMLGWLRENHCVDEARVYSTGYSNGSYFSNLLACVRPKSIAAIAAAAGGLACEPAEARPVMLSHGTRDHVVRYEEAVGAAEAWARRDGCRSAPESGADGCSTAEGCKAGPVVLCTHGGGHDLDPGFTREAAEFLKAQTRTD